jgi:pimeloyl-ACP methyl ester carboxylesterase
VPRRPRLRYAVLAAAVLVVASLVLPTRAWWKALGVAGGALDLPVPRPLAADVDRELTTVGDVDGHLYRSVDGAPPVLLVPGATPAGIHDRRVDQVARSLGAARRTVFVPDLALYEEELERADVLRLVDASTGLLEETGHEQIVLVGISYGGSMALLAAAEERIADVVDTVAVFGAYTDLIGVVQAITTGVSLVDGETYPWDGHPDAEDVLRERIVELLAPDHRDLLHAALAGEIDPEDLPGPADTFHELLVNTDPTETFPIAERLPQAVRARLGRLSPAAQLEDVAAEIVAIHATDDPLVPYGEGVRLVAHRPDATLLPLTTFGHVEVDPTAPRTWLDSAADLARVWRFTARVVGAQEPALPRLR